MNFYQIWTIIGVPSVLSCAAFLYRQGKKVSVLMKAQQAQMRQTLMDLYHKYKDQGYVEDDDMDDWENQYQAYHSLGKNGILDKRREELLKLPSKK